MVPVRGKDKSPLHRLIYELASHQSLIPACSSRETLADEALGEDDAAIYQGRLGRATRESVVGEQHNTQRMDGIRHDNGRRIQRRYLQQV